MKKLFFLALAGLIAIPACAQSSSKLISAPPNCVAVQGDYLWMSTTEVTNMVWKEYLYDLKKDGNTEAYTAALPDSLVWRSQLAYGEPYVEYYFRHPAYHNYPVVGVSQQQAEAFCGWLTDKLNELYDNNDEAVTKLRVRLPTKAEWETAARGKQNQQASYPWEGTSVRCTDKKYKGNFRANFKRGMGDHMGVAGRLNDNADVTAPVYSYWPNDVGLYNMSGNVAEWLAEPGETKGGSWRTTAWYLRIDADDDREKTGEAANDIGFRYVIDVVQLKDDLPRKKDLNLTAKFLESSTVYTREGLFTATTEVPNRLYQEFIESLEATNPTAASQHRQQNQLWASVSPYPVFQNHSHDPREDNHPAVNISYESANAFCDWLTEQYNSFPKRKHQKVKFRLPTEAEWDVAARGGLTLSAYPWGGPYTQNSRGCYLANFNPQELRFMKQDTSGTSFYDYPNGDSTISRTLDGGDMTLPVYSYHPNDFGLYNMSGNVAEMVAEKGVSKGGSWASTAQSLQIEAKETYEGPAPTLGFRYVMEVLSD